MRGGRGAAASCPGAPGSLPAPSFQGHSCPEASPGETMGSQRPRGTQNGGQCPRAPSGGGRHSQLPQAVLSLLLPLVFRIGQPGLGTRNLPEGRPEGGSGDRAADWASREGAGRAGPPALLTSPARPDPDAAAGSRQPPPRHHPGHLPPGPKGSPGGVTAQRPQ